jgi:hypothetical protein
MHPEWNNACDSSPVGYKVSIQYASPKMDAYPRIETIAQENLQMAQLGWIGARDEHTGRMS